MIVIYGNRITWLTFGLLTGAVWRVTRLIVTDQWPGWYRLRGATLRRWPPGPGRLTELLVCPWCVAVWVAAAAVTLWLLFPTPTLAVSLVLSVSALAGLIAAWTE